MSDHAAFMRRIIADPDRDEHRLIYADYLDERGEHDRAEFVRCQCELGEMIGDGTRCAACSWPISNDGRGCGPDGDCSFRPGKHSPEHDRWLERMKRLDALRRRERLLFTMENGPHWAWVPIPIRNHVCSNVTGSTDHSGCFTFRRGFVEEIQCSWSDWRTHCDAIRVITPLRKVKLTTWPDFYGARSPDDHTMRDNRWPGIAFELPRIETGIDLARSADWSAFHVHGGQR